MTALTSTRMSSPGSIGNTYRIGGSLYRVVHTHRFDGQEWHICEYIAGGNSLAVHSVNDSIIKTATPVDHSEWREEMIRVMARREAFAKARAAKEEAERYGLPIRCGPTSSPWDTTIVRVTKRQIIGVDGTRWNRETGVAIGGKHLPHIWMDQRERIETACGGANTFDFIKANKAAEREFAKGGAK